MDDDIFRRAQERYDAMDHPDYWRDKIEPDYEPEQAYGSAHDIREHLRYGGNRDDY